MGFPRNDTDAQPIRREGPPASCACRYPPRLRRSGGPSRQTLGLHVKRYFAVALLAGSFCVRAEPSVSEPPLTAENKARLVQILGEALRDKDITQKQYDQSVSWVHTTPCKGVDRQLTTSKKTQLEVAIAKEQKRQTVKVFESFQYGAWSVLFTDASDGDEPYMFYSKSPLQGGRPVTLWSGAATIFETSEVAQWVKENAPGIPSQLAECFAWHVTLSPE